MSDNHAPSRSRPELCSVVTQQNHHSHSLTEVALNKRERTNDFHIAKEGDQLPSSVETRLIANDSGENNTYQDNIHNLECNEIMDHSDLKTNSDFTESLAIAADTAAQTVETFTKNCSTQWSPGLVSTVLVKSLPCATEIAPSSSPLLLCNKALALDACTQTLAPFDNNLTLAETVIRDHSEKETLVDRGVQTTRHMSHIYELKKEVERLERELGVARSTLVWQSLMMRLHQL